MARKGRTARVGKNTLAAGQKDFSGSEVEGSKSAHAPEGAPESGTEDTPDPEPEGAPESGTEDTPDPEPEGAPESGTEDTPDPELEGDLESGTEDTPDPEPEGEPEPEHEAGIVGLALMEDEPLIIGGRKDETIIPSEIVRGEDVMKRLKRGSL